MTQDQLQTLLGQLQGNAQLQQQLKALGSANATTVVDLVKQAGFSLPINGLEGMKLNGDELEVMAGGAATGPVGSADCSMQTNVCRCPG